MLRAVPNPYAGGKHDARRSHHTTGTDDFVGIDGEGVTLPNGEHRYVLLGAGAQQIEDPAGLHYNDILEFIYAQRVTRHAFTGFFLGYDFTQWVKTFPEEKARRLLTIEGRESRRSKSPHLKGKFLPVDIGKWQVDMLGSKRFMFRRKECGCGTVKCEHYKGPWCYVCDAGPFFQTSFLNVINPANWQSPIVTDEEYALILRGKETRSTATLDDDMRFYNRLENEIMARVMRDLDAGFRKLDVVLAPQQWYGPGQAAQSWMRGRAPTHKQLTGAVQIGNTSVFREPAVPGWFMDAARKSYFGGWFELMAHGHVKGTSYESDINNAYPYIISRLPCLLHGTYSKGTGKPPNIAGAYTLVRCLAWSSSPYSDRPRNAHIGAMLHRTPQGRILRPIVTSGWFWKHEIDAAQRAGLITRITSDRIYEWCSYEPCNCQSPLWQVRNLYQLRLDVGKKSSLGKAAKLTNNSIYGKTAQSIGSPQFANPVYASLITAGCRTMILDAIATHPKGKANVLMVATDAVFFRDPHPLLPYGERLGDWELKKRENLTLFKPGVYWDDAARTAIQSGDPVAFKARGISARDFSSSLRQIDEEFDSWTPDGVTWPRVEFTSGFAMTTALQALVRNDWTTAGTVSTGKPLVQDSNPEDKRNPGSVSYDPQLMAYRSQPHLTGSNAVWRHHGNPGEWDYIEHDRFDSVPYEKRFGMDDPFADENTQAYGVSPDEHQPFRGAFRLLTGAE